MAKQRPSVQKRQREFEKRQRALRKAERAERKRQRRMSGDEPDEPKARVQEAPPPPPGDEPASGELTPPGPAPAP